MEKITNTIFTIIGIILGYLSFVLTGITSSPELNVLILVAVLFLTKFILQQALKIKKPMNWWLSNGVVVCIFLWLIVWTIFYNL